MFDIMSATECPRCRPEVTMIQNADLRVLGEQNPRLEHRHGDRWLRMERTIPVLTNRYPKSYRGTWKCSCSLVVLHEWRAPTEAT
jgi:hypothetical protein